MYQKHIVKLNTNIMNTKSMFRLKIQYKSESQETGEIKKTKIEILAQCANYTDAERLVNKLIEHYGMDKFEPCSYDITQCKFEVNAIYGNNILKEESKNLYCNLSCHYFEEKNDGLYAVDVVIFGDKSRKEKDVKDTYYIPASSVAEAMVCAQKILIYNCNYLDNCLIQNVKLDNAEYIYLASSTSERIYKEGNVIFS